MSEFRLDNYLRMYRKRAGFSQAEVAFLLGLKGGADVSRHEQNRRVPTLETALAYEIILGVPSGELFAGRIERLARRLAMRAARLAETIDRNDPDAAATLASLTRIANRSPLP